MTPHEKQTLKDWLAHFDALTTAMAVQVSFCAAEQRALRRLLLKALPKNPELAALWPRLLQQERRAAEKELSRLLREARRRAS